MKYKAVLSIIFCTILAQLNNAQCTDQSKHDSLSDKVVELKLLLEDLSSKSDSKYFTIHYKSILKVINSKNQLTERDIELLESFYDEFSMDSLSLNPGKKDCYLERKRELIIAWISPTDSAVSFTLLQLPKNWDPKTKYPLYVRLHGKWGVADNPIDYLTRPFLREPASTFAFEDGYLISPWAIGNHWYKGISETDIWECISTIEELVEIDTSRKYLCGFSMGGFGAFYLGQKSVNTWAALGLYSPSFWYNNNELVKEETINKVIHVPTYFVFGTKDGTRKKAKKVHKMMLESGNKNIELSVFKGGHEYHTSEFEKMYKWMKKFKN